MFQWFLFIFVFVKVFVIVFVIIFGCYKLVDLIILCFCSSNLKLLCCPCCLCSTEFYSSGPILTAAFKLDRKIHCFFVYFSKKFLSPWIFCKDSLKSFEFFQKLSAGLLWIPLLESVSNFRISTSIVCRRSLIVHSTSKSKWCNTSFRTNVSPHLLSR